MAGFTMCGYLRGGGVGINNPQHIDYRYGLLRTNYKRVNENVIRINTLYNA